MKTILSLVFGLLFVSVWAQQKNTISALEFQNHLNEEFADAEDSPLMKEDLAVFKRLDFFPIDEKYIVTAKFFRTKKEPVFQMKTSTSRLPEYKKYGELHFKLEGKEYRLNVYQNMDLIQKKGYEDYLFLPFSDETNGKESYIGGRYLDLRIQKGSSWIVDFNKAYNPYCAYNYKYSCPLVPMENDLTVEIKAGVKKFHD